MNTRYCTIAHAIREKSMELQEQIGDMSIHRQINRDEESHLREYATKIWELSNQLYQDAGIEFDGDHFYEDGEWIDNDDLTAEGEE